MYLYGMKKIWKKVENHSYYEISNYGEVKSLKRNKLLTPRVNDKGYLSVILYYDNGLQSKSYRIHRLVLSTFQKVDYTSHPLECGHLDDNKNNNRLDNLTWLTRKENMNWNGLSSRIKRSTKPKGQEWVKMITERNSKKIYSENIKTGIIKKYNSIADAKRDGFNAGNISACCRKERKKHKGFKWFFLVE